MNYELTELYTGLPVILSPMPETPRMALAVAFAGGMGREEAPAIAKLATRLLVKGTETRSAEALARELDERAIDLREMVFTDCTLLLAVFLNRDLEPALEILEDIIFHSTFADFDKECAKLEGEIHSGQDMPAEHANDLLMRTLFHGHPYGHVGTRILETLPTLQEDTVRQWHQQGLNPRHMNVTLVGDFDPEDVLPRLDDTFSDLVERRPFPVLPFVDPQQGDVVVTEPHTDAQQAQVYQGWYAPPLGAGTQAPTQVMNTVLGAAGLSSRLFVELRDKQGLAYSVRSQYVPMRLTGEFIVSIGTSPENIARARQGFAEQITRVQDEPITIDELQNAKGRLSGSFVLTHETTSQRCLDMAINQINGMGPDYSTRLLEQVQAVTIADVQEAAQAITTPSVTAIVAREDALSGI